MSGSRTLGPIRSARPMSTPRRPCSTTPRRARARRARLAAVADGALRRRAGRARRAAAGMAVRACWLAVACVAGLGLLDRHPGPTTRPDARACGRAGGPGACALSSGQRIEPRRAASTPRTVALHHRRPLRRRHADLALVAAEPPPPPPAPSFPAPPLPAFRIRAGFRGLSAEAVPAAAPPPSSDVDRRGRERRERDGAAADQSEARGAAMQAGGCPLEAPSRRKPGLRPWPAVSFDAAARLRAAAAAGRTG